MILVLERGTSPEEQQAVLSALRELDLQGRILENLRKPVVHVVEGPTFRARKLLALERVEALLPTSGPRIRRQGRRFYPYHFINWSSAGLLAIGILVLMAGFAPPGVGAEVDPHVPPADLSPPWYLRAPLFLVHLFPEPWLGWLALVLVFVLLFLAPYVDRTRGEGPSAWSPRLVIALVAAVAWGVATFGGGLA